MDTKVAAISIIVEDMESVDQLNALLHQHRDYIIGRMGIPYRIRGIHVIMIAVDAPMTEIESLTKKLSDLEGVSASTAYSHV